MIRYTTHLCALLLCASVSSVLCDSTSSAEASVDAPTAALAAVDTECIPLVDLVRGQPGHELFVLALEATAFEFHPSVKYTVLLPSDGPEDGEKADGTEVLAAFCALSATTRLPLKPWPRMQTSRTLQLSVSI